MKHLKDAAYWTRKHELTILFIIMVLITVSLISIIAHREGKIDLLKEQLKEEQMDTEIVNMLYNDSTGQVIELQSAIEAKEAELAQVRDALNRVIMAP